MAEGKFGTAINCIDGRAQKPVSEWVKQNHSIDYVDTVTEPGADKALLMENQERIEQVRTKVNISIKAHGSTIIVIAGHHDCAGNPVSKDEHIEQIKKSVEIIKSWNFPVKVFGLWVNDQWTIDQVE